MGASMERDINKFCKQRLSSEEISKRKGPGGMLLDYVSGYYTTTKLNECFGHAGWSFERLSVSTDVSLVTDRYGKDKRQAYCVYEGRLIAGASRLDDVGVGHGTGSTPGEAVESAIKEARTDCLKRCAKDLGPVFGLALYDKEQREVQDAASTPYAELLSQGKQIADKTAFERWTNIVGKAAKGLSNEELAQLKAVKESKQKELA